MFRRKLSSGVVSFLTALLLAACGTTTVTPMIRPTGGLPRPDRVLVFDFAVTPQEAGLERSPRFVRQTEEETRVGRAVAHALSVNLVRELRNLGIEAYRASETSPPGETTASIRGRFLRTDQGDSTSGTPVGFAFGREIRTHVQFYQGSGRNLQLVGEGEATTQSSVKPGTGATPDFVEADAQRTARAVAERVASYYRREGWIK
ncbi:MAG TPA: DUF4410 domain-containing protein [Candidatus Binatia bacterium]|nr:DUF4410 domain-containing protein [Candidatus Binatia bacterium]